MLSCVWNVVLFQGHAHVYAYGYSVFLTGLEAGRMVQGLNELFIHTQPAHLQKTSQQKLNAEERDFLRAEIIRGRLKLFPKPDMGKVAREPDDTPSESNHNE